MGIPNGAGSLDRRITFQRLPTERDESGDLVGDPVTDFACAAAFEPVGGIGIRNREFLASEKRHAESTGRFFIRYRKDFNVRTAQATHQILMVEDRSASPIVTRTFDIKDAQAFRRAGYFVIEVSEVR